MVNIALILVAFCFMEFVAWFNHKFVMHGFLWKWHVDHHRKDHQQPLPEKTEDKRLEKNDLFFLVYAIPAIVLLITGFAISYYPIVYIGFGITLYGLTYFIIHDIIIHKRINIPFLHKRHHFLIKAVINAHKAHHWPKSKDDFHNFGLLVFPRRFLKM
jgi:beta-carotene 3-hydroxylase